MISKQPIDGGTATLRAASNHWSLEPVLRAPAADESIARVNDPSHFNRFGGANFHTVAGSPTSLGARQDGDAVHDLQGVGPTAFEAQIASCASVSRNDRQPPCRLLL